MIVITTVWANNMAIIASGCLDFIKFVARAVRVIVTISSIHNIFIKIYCELKGTIPSAIYKTAVFFFKL